jgi:hypothetical protein
LVPSDRWEEDPENRGSAGIGCFDSTQFVS